MSGEARQERDGSQLRVSKQVTTVVTKGRLFWGSQGHGVECTSQPYLGSGGAGVFIDHLLLLVGLELPLYLLTTLASPTGGLRVSHLPTVRRHQAT